MIYNDKFFDFHINGRYMLFGPPGIGKSTTIQWLKEAGFKVLDLETVSPDSWDEAISTTDAQFIGAAGVHPSTQLPDGMHKILLYVSQTQYEERRARRDENQPDKALQRTHTIAEWKEFDWDIEIRNSSGDCDRWQTLLSNFLTIVQYFDQHVLN